MRPWELLDVAPVPGGGALRLLRRGGEFVIRLADGTELMNSRVGGSEEALARLGLAHLDGAPAPRVLVGGLGLGFTLRAALVRLGPDAAVEVAELVPAVAAWARGPLAPLHAGALDDPRVRLREGDVAPMIRRGAGRPGGDGRYDALLLDVDNGPDGLARAGNDGLYGARGLAAARAALRPGGALAVWSAAPDARFARRLADAGFAVSTATVRAYGRRGTRHVIWVGRRDG